MPGSGPDLVAYAEEIPFCRPYLTGREAAYIAEVCERREFSTDGRFARRASEILTTMTRTPIALLTGSGTHALELAALLLDLEPGDEVIMPSFTFPSTANAFVLRNAVPVFVDCRSDTLDIDERLIEEAITERTRAIVVVHYGGVACEMRSINAIAARWGLAVVEDNAHGLGGQYHGRPLGSLGALAIQSFHFTKNVQCGEGGALLVDAPELVDRAREIREKGTNRHRFERGLIDRYEWVNIGSSYLLAEVLAAFLVAQLERFASIQDRRMHIWQTYHDELAEWANAHEVARPTVPAECAHPAHVFYLLLPDSDQRQRMLRHLRDHGVQATTHYEPLHLSPAGRRYGRRGPRGCPVTEQVARGLIRLPLYPDMTPGQVERVVTAVTSCRL